jgi:ATP-dependent DNA helicase RecQ
VLRGQREVMLRKDAAVPKPSRAQSRGASGQTRTGDVGPSPEALSPEDEAVFEKLRAWRGATAKEQSVPAYVVFHDATLRQIAVTKPASLAELSDINGVGESKLAKYGQQILDLFAAG